VLVGDGPEPPAIEELVRERGLERLVLLLGLRSDVPRSLAASDIALVTSISEGILLTLIEAMAVRLPVVATEVGGVPEVAAGRSGLLEPPDDEEALAAAVLRMAGNRDLREGMGRQGRDDAASLFSEQTMHQDSSRV